MPGVLEFLRQMGSHKLLTAPEADHLAEVFRNAPIEHVHIGPQAARVWDLRHNISPYDACYIAASEELGAPQVTTDLRLARAATGVVPVIVV